MGPKRAGASRTVTKMAVGPAADDADGAGFRAGEAHETAAHEGDEDAQLCGRAQQQGLGVGNEGTEVRHSTHAHEDQAGIDAQLHTQVENVHQSRGDGDVREGHAVVGSGLLRLHQRLKLCFQRGDGGSGLLRDGGDGLFHHLRGEGGLGGGHQLLDVGGQHVFCYALTVEVRQQRRRDGLPADEVPVDVAPGEEDLVEHIGTGEVGDEHTEGDGHQQQRLKLLYNAQIQQHAGDAQHDEAAPVAVLGKEVEAGVL